MAKIVISVQAKTTTVRLALGVSTRIDKLVESRRRAEFIRNAVTKELRRREGRRPKE